MEVAFTWDRDSGEDQYMVCANEADWRELLRNLDGIGHSPAAMALIAGLKGWGITK